MDNNFKIVAKTFYGMEEVLAKELLDLGAQSVEIGNRIVTFMGDKGFIYKANLCLHSALKILKPILNWTPLLFTSVFEILLQSETE